MLGASAQAATVTVERGEVLVSRGKGFVLVTKPTEVVSGDQIMARPKGSGRIAFEDGCIATVVPGVVFTVASASPCQRSGSHIETGGSLKDGPTPEQRLVDDRRDVLPFLAVLGVAAGFVLLPTKDRAASP
jgi:hypothetical protein